MAHIILSGLFQPYGMVDWLKQSAFNWSNNPAASTMHSVAYHPLQVWFFPQIFACHCLLLPSISFFSPLKKSVGQEGAHKTNPLTLYRHIDKETWKVDILTHDLQFEHHCPSTSYTSKLPAHMLHPMGWFKGTTSILGLACLIFLYLGKQYFRVQNLEPRGWVYQQFW